MFDTLLFEELKDPRYSYRNVHIPSLVMIVLILGLAIYALYDFYKGTNPVKQTNFAYVEGSLKSAEVWQTEHGRGFNIVLKEFPQTFTPEVGRAFNEEDFLKSEVAGTRIRVIVDKGDFKYASKDDLVHRLRHVHIYQLVSEKRVYFRTIQANRYYEDDKQYALWATITLLLFSLIFFPTLIVNKEAEVKVDRSDVFFGCEPRMMRPDRYTCSLLRKVLLKLSASEGVVFSVSKIQKSGCLRTPRAHQEIPEGRRARPSSKRCGQTKFSCAAKHCCLNWGITPSL